jgi:demethylmenaquinone methyltransferase/2-methoxy-6-polyprenyl-1,4-benzoquinol methylase
MSPEVHAEHGSTGAESSADPLAWREDELDGLHQREDKASKVRRMFAAIAGSYDLNNRLHSLWRDQAWRRFAVRAAEARAGDRVLDAACGTGDLTQAFARTRASAVVGLDFTAEMLTLARAKRDALPDEIAGKIEYVQGDAMSLPFEDAAFDIVSIAFGIRNVQRPEAAVAEFARVLRPGGRLVVLEFDRPRSRIVRSVNDFYSGWLMPRTATAIARDRSGAYRYLPKSVGSFMSREEMMALLERSGFDGVSARGLTLGICACYRGCRAPGSSSGSLSPRAGE